MVNSGYVERCYFPIGEMSIDLPVDCPDEVSYGRFVSVSVPIYGGDESCEVAVGSNHLGTFAEEQL